jgi:SAM-dependent MidA family methyltransferase
LQDLIVTNQKYSIKLQNYIKNQIKQSGGAISFAKFMQLALYTPSLGYYLNPGSKFGRLGDYITAPMIGSLLANCVSNKCLNILEILKTADILELGAGDGQLANNIINNLAKNKCFNNYFILEPSYELKLRQQKLLNNNIYKNKIFWLDKLPIDFNGIILANEVLDALPVCLFSIKDNNIFEKLVIVKDNKFKFINTIADQVLTNKILQLPLIKNNNKLYTSEICLLVPGLIKSLSECLNKGAILLIDYGFLEQEYYHPDRNEGTLRCYFKHLVHRDPFFLPGLQDITAHVDFSLVIREAIANNLLLLEFCSMANFLIENGLQAELEKIVINSMQDQIKLNQELNMLISPQEMGEIFKIAILSKQLPVTYC